MIIYLNSNYNFNLTLILYLCQSDVFHVTFSPMLRRFNSVNVLVYKLSADSRWKFRQQINEDVLYWNP